MKINIIQIGKTKNPSYKKVEEEFIKRISHYGKIEIINIKEIDHKSIKSPSEIEIIKKKENEEIIKKIKSIGKCGKKIALDEKGDQFSSMQFSKLIEENIKNNEDITFIIGGCFGLHKNVLEISDKVLSLSKMTFTHEMIRQFLLEQVFRAYTIINKKTYHY